MPGKKANKERAENKAGPRLMQGAVITEPGSSRKYKTGDWRVFRPVILQGKCIKCSICWQVCPDAAIRVDEKTGSYSVDYDYCKGCLMCVKQCPVKAIIQEVEVK